MTVSNRQQMGVTDTDGTSLRVGPVPESLPMFDGGPDRASAAKPTQVKSAARGLLFVAIASVLSACASLPNDSAGPRLGSVADYASSHSLIAPVGAWPTESWWQSYSDAQLDALIREALAGSPNIAVAEAPLRRSQAAVQIADSARSSADGCARNFPGRGSSSSTRRSRCSVHRSRGACSSATRTR